MQNSVATVAIVPFETQAAFCPWITHSLPSLRATQFGFSAESRKWGSLNASESLPWSGSVIAQQPISRDDSPQKRSISAGRPDI